MATYTLTINERTSAGKALLEYLLSLGVITAQSKATDSYAKEIARRAAGVKSGKIKTRPVEKLLEEV